MHNNILQATATIKGLRPILWHAFGPDAIPLEKRERTGVAGNDPEEWTRTVLMTRERQLFLPPTYIFGCLRDAAKYTRKGKATIQSALSATLQVVGDRILVDRFVPDPPTPDPDQSVYLYISSVKNPTTKARNVRYRVGAAPGWTLGFTVQWDRTIVSRSELEAVLTDAGALVGLGNGRSIGFGRFTVESFTVDNAS